MAKPWEIEKKLYPRKYEAITDKETGKQKIVGIVSPQLQKAFDSVVEKGVANFTRPELKQIARSLIREANLRYRELENAGLTDTPAFRYMKEYGKLSAAGKDTNKIKKNIRLAIDFISSKTSTVEGARTYLSKTIETWVKGKTSHEQRERIWDLYHRLEQIHPGYFAKELYSSGELAADTNIIYRVLAATDFDVDRALEIIEDKSGLAHLSEELETDLAREKARWIGG